MDGNLDWIIYVLISIIIFKIWQCVYNVKFSWRNLLPWNLFNDDCKLFLTVTIFVGIGIIFSESVEFRIFVVWGGAIFCGICLFRREQKNMQKQEMGFIKKITEYIYLILLSLFIGFLICIMSISDIKKYELKQQIKEIQQQAQQPKPKVNQYGFKN